MAGGWVGRSAPALDPARRLCFLRWGGAALRQLPPAAAHAEARPSFFSAPPSCTLPPALLPRSAAQRGAAHLAPPEHIVKGDDAPHPHQLQREWRAGRISRSAGLGRMCRHVPGRHNGAVPVLSELLLRSLLLWDYSQFSPGNPLFAMASCPGVL